MDKKELIKALLVGVEHFIDSYKNLGEGKVTSRDYANFLDGLISGLTFPADVHKIIEIHKDEIVDMINKSKAVKKAGLDPAELHASAVIKVTI